MENLSYKDLLAGLQNVANECSYIDGSCAYAHVTLESALAKDAAPPGRFKVDGTVCLFLTKGAITCEMDTEDYRVEAPASLILHHGSSVSFRDVSEDTFEIYVLAYSAQFLQELNISFSSISSEVLFGAGGPTMQLREREVPVLLRYCTLLHTVMSDRFNLQLNRHIVSNLTSAMFYQLMLILYRRIDTTDTSGIGPRRSTYVQDFLRLVHIYYTRERSVSFYASKLFISPKYLSLLVKNATGRSAARWIDHFVITEAKNLLRYSGKNVQQVAYALNFTNQSSFGKYFKHITGQSPTEYQKS